MFTMKLLLLLVAVSYVAWASVQRREMCTTNDNCTTTQCGGGASVICQHPAGAPIVPGGGLCTCSSGTGCTVASDCYGSAVNLECEDAIRHCLDNKCICDRFPTFG